MKKILDKSTKEFQMFQDYWKMYQFYYIPENNERYWNSIALVTNKFMNKYNTELAKDLTEAFIAEMERKYKKMEV